MLSLILEASGLFDKAYEKIVKTKNYIVQDFANPTKEFISKYRSKTVIDKDGKKHLLTFAVLNKKGKESTGKKTVMTSAWHPKDESSAQNELKTTTKPIKSESQM